MYSPLYNRLSGWLFFALGIIGLTAGRIGDYLKVTGLESTLYISIGVIGMFAARIRIREAGVTCFILGFSLLVSGLIGIFWPDSFLGFSEPAESAIRTIAGCWGIYAAVSDLLTWVHA